GLDGVANLFRDTEFELLVVDDRGHRQVVDVLEDVRREPAGDDLRDGGHDLVEIAEGGEHGRAVRQPRIQLDDDFGGQGERALGADDQLGEVVAGGDLGRLAAGPDDLAGRQHRLQPEHVVPGDAVLDRTHAARVRPDIPADARAQFAGIDGVTQPGFGGLRVEFGQRDAGLHDGHLVLGIDLE